MAKKNKENVKPVGRPPEDIPEEDRARPCNVSLSNNEKKYLIEQYGGLTKAVRSLLK